MTVLQARTPREDPPVRLPTEQEIEQAREASRRLGLAPAGSGTDRASAVRVMIREEDGTEGELEMPPLALALLDQILAELARGNAVALEPVRALLTAPEAAELLGVSPSFVTGLIDEGDLPGQMVGTQQRILFEDLIAYKKKNYEERSKVLDELVAQAQELGMGY